MIIEQPNCTDTFEAGLLSVDQALKQVLSALPVIKGFECITIEKAKGRTLFESISASFNVPRYNNSAVDGYAINSSDLAKNGISTLTIIGTAYAGTRYPDMLQPGQCIRIMTGAIIPDNVDTVVMQEQVKRDNTTISIDAHHKAGQNIRLAGEDMQTGQTILHTGKFLTAADIGLMASLGISEIKVKRKLKIAIISTGDEIRDIGDTQSSHGTFDSNRYILHAALDRPDIEIIDLGILKDDPDILLNRFNQASQYSDITLSSGGVSVGDADHTKNALKQSGDINFWKVAIKPGRPLAFGHIGNCVFFGLPGNPVAVMVNFYQFVLPALEQMLKINNKPVSPKIQVQITENLGKKKGRTEIVRGILYQDNAGAWMVKTTGKQGSGILRSMSLANAFIILEHDKTAVKNGEYVTVQPFAGLF